MTKIKNNPQYIEEERQKQEDKLITEDIVIEEIQHMIKMKEPIYNANTVSSWLNSKHDLSLTDRNIRIVLKQRLGYKFKKIKTIPYKANCDKNLILRQQFGLKLLELLH